MADPSDDSLAEPGTGSASVDAFAIATGTQKAMGGFAMSPSCLCCATPPDPCSHCSGTIPDSVSVEIGGTSSGSGLRIWTTTSIYAPKYWPDYYNLGGEYDPDFNFATTGINTDTFVLNGGSCAWGYVDFPYTDSGSFPTYFRTYKRTLYLANTYASATNTYATVLTLSWGYGALNSFGAFQTQTIATVQFFHTWGSTAPDCAAWSAQALGDFAVLYSPPWVDVDFSSLTAEITAL